MRHAARRALAALLVFFAATAQPADLEAQTIASQALERAQDRPLADTSLRGVVEDAIEDFRNVPSWQNLAILTAGGIGATFAHTADHDVTAAMSSSPSMGTALQAGETVGGARMQLAAALATYTIGRVAGHQRTTALGADLIGAQIVTQAMTAAIKLSVGRTRPDGTQYSFPSGHSSVTFATATVLQRNFGWKAGLPAYGLATYVAASRVHDKRHFLSDVAFGAALGIIGGRAVTVGRGDATFAMSPAPAPGGAALAFTWVGSR